MKIKVCSENADKIEAALSEVNGTATKHTYSRYLDIISVIDRAELKLKNLLKHKKEMIGAKFVSVSGDEVPKKYTNNRIATKVTLELLNSGWHLVEIDKEIIYADGGKETVILNEEQVILAMNYFKFLYRLKK